jgi:hypothetical protein
MTLHLLDIASYQAGLDLGKAKAAGFGAVNIKTSQGNSYTFQQAPDWAKEARRLGMGICTFHWLDNSTSGAEQARIAFDWMKRLGGPQGMAHQCDNEDNATWQITRDYAAEMQHLLGRNIAMYTGDWWWTGRGWNGASLTPYVWAAPNAGYLNAYPGDQSPHWRANYGAWNDYSVLQYNVGPIAGAGGGNVSKSAIRDPKVWAVLTGGTDSLSAQEVADIKAAIAAEGNLTRRQVINEALKLYGPDTTDGYKTLGGLRALVEALAARPPADAQHIIDGVLAGLGGKPLDEVAAALRAAFGPRLAELAAKLATPQV